MRTSEQGDLWLVTGLGHCGTMWLARTMNRPQDGVHTQHSGMARWMPSSPRGVNNYQHGVLHYVNNRISTFFDYYFSEIERLRSRYRVVVDCMSWIPAAVLDVTKRLDVTGIIWLVRNGVRQVNSLHKLYHGGGKDKFWFRRVINHEADTFGWPFPQGLSAWECWCRWWGNQPIGIEEMHKRGLPLEEHRLEDLTGDSEYLRRFLNRFGIDVSAKESRQLGGSVINEHVGTDARTVAVRLNRNREKRTVFAVHCSEAMKRWGYL